MSHIKIVIRFIKYFFRARTKYDIHSPIVYDFIMNVLEDRRTFYIFGRAEGKRLSLKQNHTKISVTDLGAGSLVNNNKTKSISTIAKSALSPGYQCKMLFRIINHFKPKTMIEIGASLGIASIYQKSGSLNAKMIALEGCPNISEVARNVYQNSNLDIKVKTGNFDTTFKEALLELKSIDYVFFDGNHQYQPTLDYFNTALEHAHSNSVFVFDDIHWSSDMERAWEEIRMHPKVTVALDLFHFGLILFHDEIEHPIRKSVIPWRYKPWRNGFWG